MSRTTSKRLPWRDYTTALLLVAAASLVRLEFLGFLGSRSPFVLLYPAVVFSALQGGLGPGLLATLLSIVSATFWMEPATPRLLITAPIDMLATAAFLTVGTLISWMAERMHRASDRAAQALARTAAADAQERAATALAESEARLKLAISLSRIILCTQDREFRFTWVYDPSHALSTDPLGKTDREVFPAEDAPGISAVKHRAVETGRATSGEVRVLLDGRETWWNLRAEPMRDADGTIVGVRCASVDLTEHKLAARQLDEARARAERKAAEQAHLAVAARELARKRDLASVTAIVRRLAREMTGADGAVLVFRENGMCLMADEEAVEPLWKGRSLPMEECVSGWVMLHRQPAVIEDVYADPRVPHELYRPTFVQSLVMVPVGRDDPTAALGALWARKGRPDPEAVQVLQSLADLASVAMANVRLYLALTEQKGVAEEASRAKSEFLANMSHEIRTPLNGIIGMTDLGLMNCADPKAAKYLQLTKQSGLALLDIINDILDLSKIEAGQLELVQAPFDPRQTLHGLVSALGVVARGKDIELGYAIDPSAPSLVLGDEGRLRQILNNLIGNAIKFTGHGRVDIDMAVTGRDEAERRAWVRYTVRDTGIGIPADKLGAIFESFAQVGGSAHAKYGGTGLGLSIARELVERMGGSIRVESEVGKGSTFSVTLPFELAEARPEQAPAGRDRPPGTGRKLRILLAEDNQVNRMLATELLRGQGHTVETAEDGREALARLAAQRFDLVLMDVRMPGLDGIEATEAIRRGEAGDPAIPIIALTAHALKGDRERFLAAGMSDYVSKPINLEELNTVMERVAG